MNVQVNNIFKNIRAVITFLHVYIQVRSLCKPFTAILTFIQFFTGVNTLERCQYMLTVTFLTATFTLLRNFSCVLSKMNFQITRRYKTFRNIYICRVSRQCEPSDELHTTMVETFTTLFTFTRFFSGASS